MAKLLAHGRALELLGLEALLREVVQVLHLSHRQLLGVNRLLEKSDVLLQLLDFLNLFRLERFQVFGLKLRFEVFGFGVKQLYDVVEVLHLFFGVGLADVRL